MSSPFRRGQIVIAPVLDPQGRNLKRRPCVVLGVTPDSRLGVIGITSTLTELVPPDRVDLPYSNDPARPCSTGLTDECAAVCYWQDVVRPEDVVATVGIVPTVQLEQILSRVRQLVAARQAGSATPSE